MNKKCVFILYELLGFLYKYKSICLRIFLNERRRKNLAMLFLKLHKIMLLNEQVAGN